MKKKKKNWICRLFISSQLSMIPWNKVSLQTNLERKSSNFSYISFLDVNFENLTVKLPVPYV